MASTCSLICIHFSLTNIISLLFKEIRWLWGLMGAYRRALVLKSAGKLFRWWAVTCHRQQGGRSGWWDSVAEDAQSWEASMRTCHKCEWLLSGWQAAKQRFHRWDKKRKNNNPTTLKTAWVIFKLELGQSANEWKCKTIVGGLKQLKTFPFLLVNKSRSGESGAGVMVLWGQSGPSSSSVLLPSSAHGPMPSSAHGLMWTFN